MHNPWANIGCANRGMDAVCGVSRSSMKTIDDLACDELQSPDLPMLWNVAEPGDTRRLEGDGGVEAAGYGAVDDGLLLLVEQRDHLPLRPDRPLQPPVRPVQKQHNLR